jgi:hypothetical protein
MLALALPACAKARSAAPEGELEPPAPPPFETPDCAASATTVACADDPTVACTGVAGYEFLQAKPGYNDMTTATLTVPEPGKICVSGTLAPVAEYGSADLVVFLSPRGADATCILEPFDPREHDIAALSFDLDQLPAARMTLTLAVIQTPQCDDWWQCVDGGIYTWLTPDREEIGQVLPGTTVARLDELVGDDLQEPLAAHWISDFALTLDASPVELPYEFCISNIQLLDAAGNVVLPAPAE